LRPYRSEREPHIGVNKNCIRENIPAINPIMDSLRCNSFTENEGSRGIINPNPNRSMKIVRKIIMYAGLFFK
jgi:hypothetical protein